MEEISIVVAYDSHVFSQLYDEDFLASLVAVSKPKCVVGVQSVKYCRLQCIVNVCVEDFNTLLCLLLALTDFTRLPVYVVMALSQILFSQATSENNPVWPVAIHWKAGLVCSTLQLLH